MLPQPDSWLLIHDMQFSKPNSPAEWPRLRNLLPMTNPWDDHRPKTQRYGQSADPNHPHTTNCGHLTVRHLDRIIPGGGRKWSDHPDWGWSQKRRPFWEQPPRVLGTYDLRWSWDDPPGHKYPTRWATYLSSTSWAMGHKTHVSVGTLVSRLGVYLHISMLLKWWF